MSRDANGNYTLPSGNPVVTGTTIDTTWANPTMSDIANELTNSLDRSGRGGMLAPLTFVDGSVTAPGIGFTNETSMGFYRIVTGQLGVATGGEDNARFNTTNQVEARRNNAWNRLLDINSTETIPADWTVSGDWGFTGGLDLTNATITGLNLGGLVDIIGDTTPQLGGDLDVNGNSIISALNGNIAITPNGTGNLILEGLTYPKTDGTLNQTLITDGFGQLSFADGVQGPTGADGAAGADGADGTSVVLKGSVDTFADLPTVPPVVEGDLYIVKIAEVGVNNAGDGFVSDGTNGGWANVGAIQGPAGNDGANGADGGTGGQGVQGVQGIQGDPGGQGTQGLQGDPGSQGIQGTAGVDGLPDVKDTEFKIRDDAALDKILRFEVFDITAGTERTIKAANFDIDLTNLADKTKANLFEKTQASDPIFPDLVRAGTNRTDWDGETQQVVNYFSVENVTTIQPPVPLVDGAFYNLTIINNNVVAAGQNLIAFAEVNNVKFNFVGDAAPDWTKFVGAVDSITFRAGTDQATGNGRLFEVGRSLDIGVVRT